MVIGIPRETKRHEYRVSIIPAGVRDLTSLGHRVLVEPSAGLGSGFTDEDYEGAGAELAKREEVFGSELLVKVKEPSPEEYGLLKEGGCLFTFLHLAANTELLSVLLDKNMTALGYETLEDRGTLPLLTPMSEIAGRMSPLVASYHLQRPLGGSGILPGGTPGVLPAQALILGAGMVGTSAARVALALGMRVTVINRGIERLREIDGIFKGLVNTLPSTGYNVEEHLISADIVIGAVLIAGAKAPRLVTAAMVSGMKKGSVIVDVSVDQGGCVETTRPTTHDAPVYEVEGVIHYAVANMPGAYPRTSTLALTNCSLPYISRLASLGIERAVREDRPLRSAVNTYAGRVVHRGLSGSLNLPTGDIG